MCSFLNESIQNEEEIALQLPGSESKMLLVEINKLQCTLQKDIFRKTSKGYR